MHDVDLVITLAGGLTAALALGYVTHRLGLSPIVGYLLAGVLVGPHTPGFVANQALAEQAAEIGVILLMFGVGLQFHVDELVAVARVAVPGALLASLLAAGAGTALGLTMGWSGAGAAIFGLSLSVASTVVLVRVLADNRALHSAAGHISVGWVVVEDLLTVSVLVVLPALVGAGASEGHPAWALARAAGEVALLVVFAIVAGGRLIPVLLDRVAATRSRELFTLTVLVVAMGIAVGASRLFDVSMALGAFLAGTIVGRSDYSLRAASDALPMRDAFAVLFFVSVGMLLDPRVVVDAPLLLGGVLAIVLAGKPLVVLVVVRALGYPFRTAMSVAVSLAHIGEFSFILAALGRSLGVLPEGGLEVVVAASLLSMVVNPMAYRGLGPLGAWLAARPRLWQALNPRGPAPDAPGPGEPAGARHRAVVVGYGPTGRTVSRLLKENGVAPVVIELNIDTVRALREQGLPAVYGDAASRDTLESAGIREADTLILTSADHAGSAGVIREARGLNPRVHVLARTAYLRELPAMRAAGADEAFSGEGEVAFAFTAAILSRLGATPEQVDRERRRVHGELVGGPGGGSP